MARTVAGSAKPRRKERPAKALADRDKRLYRIGALAVAVALAVLWEVASRVSKGEVKPGHPFVPGWEFIFKNTLVGLSDYWPGGLGAPAVADGGPRTLLGSIYAIVDHSFQTLWRLLLGFALGAGIGTLVALLVSASKWARRILSLPTQIIRPFPLLAIIPIFQLWFGTETIGAITFIALVVGIIFFTGVLNAVGNVPVIYVQNSRVLGAGPVRTYLSIVVPAIFPELQSTIMLAIGTAWTAALGAEFIGAENGLGKILTVAKYFSYVDRMFLIGIIVIVLATLSFLVAQKLSKPMIAWMPDR
jgi:sulfonate transport system permease protein